MYKYELLNDDSEHNQYIGWYTNRIRNSLTGSAYFNEVFFSALCAHVQFPDSNAYERCATHLARFLYQEKLNVFGVFKETFVKLLNEINTKHSADISKLKWFYVTKNCEFNPRQLFAATTENS